MKLLTLVAFLMIALAGTAAAQLDPDDDGIGVYFDPCACVICMELEPAIYTGYIVITHPTSPEGVGGWEARITYDGPVTVTNWAFQGEAYNFMTPPDFYVGIGTPIINPFTYPAIVVATFELALLSDTPEVNFWIDGVLRHSLPDRMPAYLDGSDYNIIKPLQQPTGGPQFPVATINGGCAVPNDDLTWGDIKTLFR